MSYELSVKRPSHSEWLFDRLSQLVREVVMIFSYRRCHLIMYGCWVYLLVAPALLAAPATLGGGQAQGTPQASPWSVYSWDQGFGGSYFTPSCHQLAYFSGSPLRFAYGGEISKWPPASFTLSTNANLIGQVQQHRLYQIIQDAHTDPSKTQTDTVEYVMKRILVERRTDEFCMIFQEQGALGPSAGIVEIDPAKLTTIDQEPVLFTNDLLSGNAGARLDAAWTFDRGAPASLLSPADGANSPIVRAFEGTLPRGCQIRGHGGDPLDLANFTFEADVWKSDDSMAEPTCGHVALKLGVNNHRLVVVSKRYTP
jgi:hypothetical protein